MNGNLEGTVKFSISFVVNDPRDDRLSEEERAEIARQVLARFRQLLESDQRLATLVRIDGVAWYAGCTVVVIGIAVLAIKTLKEYKALKESVIELAKDVNGLCVRLARWSRPYSAWFYRDDEITYRGDGEMEFRRKSDSGRT